MKAKQTTGENSLEPTKSELEILEVLWQYGASTVRFVNDKINKDKRNVQYTSTLKLMQIMAEKGLLERDTSQMKHIYKPVLKEKGTKSTLLKTFIDTVFNGNKEHLLMELVGPAKPSQEEIEKIRALLARTNKT